MTIKELHQTMDRLYHKDPESYSDLYKAVIDLWNLGLVKTNVKDAMVKKDHELFEEC